MAKKKIVNARWEGIKEFLRVVVFAAVGAGLAAAGTAASLLNSPWEQMAVITAVASLGKAWDKYVHEAEGIAANGVLPF